MKTEIALALALVMAAANIPAVAQACSVCFSGDGDALTHAFNWSVGFLLAAPYVVAGTIAGCLVLAYRRAEAKRAVEEQDAQVALDALIWTQEENAK